MNEIIWSGESESTKALDIVFVHVESSTECTGLKFNNFETPYKWRTKTCHSA